MDVLEVVRADRVVAVVRAPSVADPAGLAGVLADAGIRCVEFTFTIPSVLRAIEAAAAAGALVGAGTVTEPAQAKDAIAAGARFVVSPVLVPEIVAPCRDAGVPVVLAALTPTEVLAAARAGSIAVKLFPASLGGPSYVREVRAPLPHLQLLPTGGVSADNAAEFIKAGAVALGVGSSLVDRTLVAAGDFAALTERARRLVDAVQSAR